MIKNPLTYLKLSGEFCAGIAQKGFAFEPFFFTCRQLVEGRELARLVVGVGGGNLYRGGEVQSILKLKDRIDLDQAGMLVTLANALTIRTFLKENFALTDDDVRVVSALHADEVAEPYRRLKVLSHLKKGRIVIIACGIGRPGFSTDYGMVQYADELKPDMVLKGTKVKGVYDKDPSKFPPGTPNGAIFIDRISHADYLANVELRIVDRTAVVKAQCTPHDDIVEP